MDRGGRELSTVGDPARYEHLAMSPDERRIAVTFVGSGTPENRDIWILDVARGTRIASRLMPATTTMPVWSPDNSRIVFSAIRDGANSTLRQKRLDVTTNEEAVFRRPARWPGAARRLVGRWSVHRLCT